MFPIRRERDGTRPRLVSIPGIAGRKPVGRLVPDRLTRKPGDGSVIAVVRFQSAVMAKPGRQVTPVRRERNVECVLIARVDAPNALTGLQVPEPNVAIPSRRR